MKDLLAGHDDLDRQLQLPGRNRSWADRDRL
jgi:hypothetical protein